MKIFASGLSVRFLRTIIPVFLFVEHKRYLGPSAHRFDDVYTFA
jgi:hypothetical protein